jgi:hypothetical protein
VATQSENTRGAANLIRAAKGAGMVIGEDLMSFDIGDTISISQAAR